LETQKKVQELKGDPDFELITIEELKTIRRYWRSDGDFEDRVPKIYEEIVGEKVDWEIDDHPVLNEEQAALLRRLCDEMNVSDSLMKQLIRTEQNYYSLKFKKGILQEIDQILNQEWLHL